MTYKHNHSLYEVQGRVRDNGQSYLVHCHEGCGGLVAYAPSPSCTKCGRANVKIKALPNSEVMDYRKELENRSKDD